MHKNAYRHQKGHVMCTGAPFPSIDVDAPRRLLARCPDHAETPLHQKSFGGIDAKFFIQDEWSGMGLGSFKALGAAYVIAGIEKICHRPVLSSNLVLGWHMMSCSGLKSRAPEIASLLRA
jgi:hypothetical protein